MQLLLHKNKSQKTWRGLSDCWNRSQRNGLRRGGSLHRRVPDIKQSTKGLVWHHTQQVTRKCWWPSLLSITLFKTWNLNIQCRLIGIRPTSKTRRNFTSRLVYNLEPTITYSDDTTQSVWHYWKSSRYKPSTVLLKRISTCHFNIK